MRKCQECGLTVDDGVRFCPKCDSELHAQTDQSLWTIDIAHHDETTA